MIRIIRADERHYTNLGWLKSWWLFSFSSYYDPDNLQFGDLRIFNHDHILPQCGFPTHPHENMEIVTLVHKGEITHHDNLNNKTLISTNHVHCLSAGTGVRHSEINFSEKPVQYFQIWIYPNKHNLEPSTVIKKSKSRNWLNNIYPIASGQGFDEAVHIHADATIYRCDLEPDKTLFYDLYDKRRIFIYNISGMFNVNDLVIKTNDQARIDLENQLLIKAIKKSSFILVDLPSEYGWGYSDKVLKGVNMQTTKK